MADESGLSLFDDAASAAGSFPRARKGYDPEVVDDYVIALEDAVAQLRRQNRTLEEQLNAAKEQATTAEPDYEQLGGHASTIMHGAKLQAEETTANADRERTEVIVRTEDEARQIIDRGRAEAHDVKVTALTEVTELRGRLEELSADQLQQARGDAAKIIDNANNRAQMVIAEANNAAATAREGARLEAENLRQRAARESAQIRLAAESAREELLAKLAAEHAEAAETTAALLADAEHRSAVVSEQIEANITEAIRVRNDAVSDAEIVKARAARVSEQEVQRAREQAESSIRVAEEKFAQRQREIHGETEALRARKRAILSQLANLSQLATSTAADFPDDAPTPSADGPEDELPGSAQGQPARSEDEDHEPTLAHAQPQSTPADRQTESAQLPREPKTAQPSAETQHGEPTLVDQPAVTSRPKSPRGGR